MAVPVVASSTGVLNNTFTSCQIVFTKPSGLAVGDLMTAEMWTASSSSATPTLPSGWTIPSGATTSFNATFLCQRYVAYKVADSGDVAASTFTFDIAAGPTPYLGFGVIKRITGANASPINGTPTNQTTTTGTTGTFPSATTSVADCVVLLSAGMVYNTGATPSGSQFPYVAPSGTTLSTNVPDDSNLGYLGTAYFSQVSAGATGSKTVATPSLSSSNGIFQAVTLAIAPDAGVTGSLAATEAKDTAALSGNISAGTFAATEAKDAASLTGNVASVGALAATEAQDTASIIEGSNITGTLAGTEAKDTASLAGAVSSVGTLAATEAKDAAAIAGAVSSVGTLAATEAKDAASVAGSVGSAGSLSATEAKDVAAVVGALSITGALAATEGKDTASIIGSSPAIGSLIGLEANDNAAITGQVVTVGGTYPLAIEGGGSVVLRKFAGGGSVVAGSIPSSGRVVLGSLRGRP